MINGLRLRGFYTAANDAKADSGGLPTNLTPTLSVFANARPNATSVRSVSMRRVTSDLGPLVLAKVVDVFKSGRRPRANWPDC